MPEKPTSEHSSKKPRIKTTKAEGVPAKISIEDCLKVVKVLSDKGGTGKTGDLEASFGGKKYRDILGRSLSAMARFNIFEKSGATFSLGETGRKFVVASDEEKKKMLAEKIISFSYYKDICIRLKNNPEKSIKKEDITDMWMTIAGGGKGIRQYYTTSFSSLASWCGIVEDSGRTLKLTEFGSKLLEDKLGIPTPTPPPAGTTTEIKTTEVGLSCPLCKGTEVGLKSEEIAQTIPTKKGHLIYLKYIYYCRICRSEFTRLLQQSFEGTAE